MKTSILTFILGILAGGPVVAQENVVLSSRISTAAKAVTITDESEAIIGQASSASEGHVTYIGLAEQPALRRDRGKASHSVEQSFDFDYSDDRMERAIDECTIDRLGLFDRSDDGRSGRYNVSFDLENEDSDWSFEVTVTVEF